MNTTHFKYALEVERTGSISQAAENLFMAQPNLSKAIKELEDTLGFTVFERSSRGVAPTPKGLEFLRRARMVAQQVSEIESLAEDAQQDKQSLSLSMPRGSYIADGVARFIASLHQDGDIMVNVKETNSVQTINNVLGGRFRLGIIRYQQAHENHFMSYLAEKRFRHELVWEYEYKAMFSRSHPLAEKDRIEASELERFIELAHGDQTVPYLPSLSGSEHRAGDCEARRIYLYERSMQFELLSTLPGAYMWDAPAPQALLTRWNLVQRAIDGPDRRYKDVLIYPKDCQLTAVERLFVDKLFEARNEVAFQN